MAQTVVMKFGGTSVGSTEKITAVARRVSAHRQKTGDRVVVVVSAMSGETDRLIKLCESVSGGEYSAREYNQLVASGEQVSSALTAIALDKAGVPAQSLLAHQVRVTTKHRFGQDLIADIDTSKIKDLLDRGITPIIAGFQGVNEDGDTTTLGRGGSDTTAVAVAAALGSCRCMILTDVDGVYSALPKICRKARKLDQVSYEEMLEMASAGAKILQTRSVSLAKKYKVPLFVGLSHGDQESGTEIVEEYQEMEDAVVSGVTCRTDEAKLTLENIPDQPGLAAKLFKAVADAGVIVDMIVQFEGAEGCSGLSFTVPREMAIPAEKAVEKLLKTEMSGARLTVDKSIAKLSVVGEGMRNHVGVAAQMFEVLGKEGINIELINTSEIKISVAIDEKYAELAVRALHEYFIEDAQC